MVSLLLTVGMISSAQDFGFGGNQQSHRQAQYSHKYSDINYAGDSMAYHTLDVYLPQGKRPKRGYPVVVHIYGSAWFSNNSKGAADIHTICAALLDAGYAVVCPNHRSSLDAHYPAQIQDIKAVVRWVRGNAKEYGLDSRFVATSGFSSGAHLASLCAATNDVVTGRSGEVEMDIEGSIGHYTQESSRVSACCEWSGPIDLMNMDCGGLRPDKEHSPEAVLMGYVFMGHEDAYRLLSPIHYLSPRTVPIMVCHGEADQVVPVCQGKELYEALQDARVPVSRLLLQPEGGHGFNMYSEENLREMVTFFDKARRKRCK